MKLTQITACFLISFWCLAEPAISQTTEWVRTGVSSNGSGSVEIAADKGGSSYVYGTFNGTINFGSITLNYSGATMNHYLVKYSANGTPVWAQKISGNPMGPVLSEVYLEGTTADNLAITLDQKGGIYIAGQFRDSLTIGSRRLTSPNYVLFVVKLDTNGNVKWAMKGANSANPSGLAADSLGNIYVTGHWDGNTPFQFGSSTVNFVGSSDAFLLKVRQDSAVVWAKGIGQTTGYEYTTGIAADKSGNIYVSGNFNSDAYLAKLDSNGMPLWQQWMGCENSVDNAHAVTVDPNKNVYVSGIVDRGGSAIRFDTISFPSLPGEIERFIAKYNSSGKIVWVWVENGKMLTGYQRDGYVTSDIHGNIYYGGSYRDSLALGPFKFKSGYDRVNAYVAGLSPSKPFLWAKPNTPLNNRRSQIYAMSATPFGDIYASGVFEDSVKFDSSIGYGNGVNSFVVKISMPWIFTGVIQGSPFCAGFPVTVPFTVKGNFPENTVFYLQLSDSTGSFDNAITIDSTMGPDSSPFSSHIPIDIPRGSKYRLRVISLVPTVTGLDNGIDLRIIAAPKITFNPLGPIKVCELPPAVSVTVSSPGGTVFNWRDGPTGATRSLDKAGWYYVTVENESGCERTDSILVIDLPPVEAAIAPSRSIPICEGTTVGLIASGGERYLWSTGDTAKQITVGMAGKYTVTAIDSGGCTDTASIEVTTLPAPEITISPKEILYLCPGDSVIVTASAAPNYLWSTGDTTQSIVIDTPGTYYVSTKDSNCTGYSEDLVVKFYEAPAKPTITRRDDTLSTTAPLPLQWYLNGVSISGATSQSIVVDSEGVYTVQTTNPNGCSTLSTGYAFSFSSVHASAVPIGITVSPNPALNLLIISIETAAQRNCTIELYDMLGKKIATVFSGLLSSGDITYDLPSGLSHGTYMLRVSTGELTYSLKFMKE